MSDRLSEIKARLRYEVGNYAVDVPWLVNRLDEAEERNARLVDAIRLMCTEMPEEWMVLFTEEGREREVETVRAVLSEMDDDR